MEIRPEGLGRLRSRYIRYWTVADRDKSCEFGWLIGFDSHGVLVSGSESQSPSVLDGAVFLGWDKIDHLQFVEEDEKEVIRERCHGSGKAGEEAEEARDEAARGGSGAAAVVGAEGLPEITPEDDNWPTPF